MSPELCLIIGVIIGVFLAFLWTHIGEPGFILSRTGLAWSAKYRQKEVDAVKQCPRCKATFNDDQIFCGLDGTRLKNVVLAMEKSLGEEAKDSAKGIMGGLGKLAVLGMKATAKGLKDLAEKEKEKEKKRKEHD